MQTRNLKRFGWSLALAGLAAGAFAQGAVIYAPTRSIDDQGISVRAWGSGAMAQTDELAFEGSWSLRVSTRNYFAGGMMNLARPVDLSAASADKNNLLRFQIRMAESVTLSGGGARGGTPGTGTGAGTGSNAGSLDDGGPVRGTSGSTTIPETSLRNIRLIVTTTDGKKSEVYIPVGTSRPGERGWLSVAVPIQAITGLDKTNKMISQIAIAGDATTTFYIGDIRVINDSTPINGGVRQSMYNLALGDEAEFAAWGFGGSSVLRYSWDFDESDGIQDEAEGPVVKRKFRVAGPSGTTGKYVVTLTISDVYGLKPPYTTKINVTVNP